MSAREGRGRHTLFGERGQNTNKRDFAGLAVLSVLGTKTPHYHSNFFDWWLAAEMLWFVHTRHVAWSAFFCALLVWWWGGLLALWRSVESGGGRVILSQREFAVVRHALHLDLD
jgi:hypothetical protein